MDDIKITFAPSDTVDTFPVQMGRVLSALGHPEAFVTDESQVSDFLCSVMGISPERAADLEKRLGRPVRAVEISPDDQADIQADNERVLQSLADLMGRPVDRYEYLGALARQLYLKDQPSTQH